MRLSFAYFALALPLLAASQANYFISQGDYYIYIHDFNDQDSPVNITEFDRTVSLIWTNIWHDILHIK